MKLPFGFSPKEATKQVGDWMGVYGDDSRAGDYDVLGSVSVAGGARDPAGGGLIGSQGSVNAGYEPNGFGGFTQVLGANTDQPAQTTAASAPAGGGLTAEQQAAIAKRNGDTAKAKEIRDRLLGKSGEVDTILGEILAAIDVALGDKKKRRQEKYDTDVAALLESLNAATPEVEKAFASLGLSSSTFVGDRLKGVEDEWQKSQDATEDQFETDLADYGSVAEQNKTDVKGSATKIKNGISYLNDTEADADNLGRFQESENTFNNALVDLGGQKAKFGTEGDFLKALDSLDTDYDFGKTLSAFGDFAGSAAAINNPNKAERVANGIKGVGKDKKKLTEVQENNPVGAATA